MSASRWLCMGCESLNDPALGECPICGMPYSESEQLRLAKVRRESVEMPAAVPVKSPLTDKPTKTLTPDAAPPKTLPPRPPAPRLPSRAPTPPGFYPALRSGSAGWRESIRGALIAGASPDGRREIARHALMFGAVIGLVLLPPLLLLAWNVVSGADTYAQINGLVLGALWGGLFGFRMSRRLTRRALLTAFRRAAVYTVAIAGAVVVSGVGSVLLIRAYDLTTPPTIFPMSFVLASVGLCGGVMLYALSKGIREELLLHYFVEVMRLAFVLGIGAGVVLWFGQVVTEVLVSMELGDTIRLWMATSGLTALENTISLLRALLTAGIVLLIGAYALTRSGSTARISVLAGVFGVVIGTLFSMLLPLTQTLHEIAAIAVWSATAGGAISLLNDNILAAT